MPRELSFSQSLQTDYLKQLGVVSWFAGSEPVTGVVHRTPQPWSRADGQASPVETPLKYDVGGFAPAKEPVPPKPVAPEQKDASVANLRQQLNAAPDVIVEDLQPIEEQSVDIDPVEEIVTTGLPARVHMASYRLADELLLLTDLPLSFNDDDALDKLALNLGKALLKKDIDQWQKATFIWPGKLRNRYLLNRQDWILGAFEQFIVNQVAAQPPRWVIVAGEQGAQFIDALPSRHALKGLPCARVDSLPQMLRVPELRKDAWRIMQSVFGR
ncbi:hypothetical protein DN730_10625 [Marinomonas piezotolerans]|uniref:Uncharacterized protein n=1 Tax=Marinomonas piezotolerans TaxID=2213058 RepID=A0A370U8I9_9GAMM|nr:hypothetical protein [Marinomonas piezotolerans]RDL44082.1 hypothetical protein DN730_10625 [Marinomonas piezotolerans]